MLNLHQTKRRKADGLKVTVAKGYYELILLHLNVTAPTVWCYPVHGSRSPGVNKYSATSILGRLEISLL